MIGLRRLAAAVAVVCSLLCASPGSAQPVKLQARAHPHVYLLRSFMDVFSSGIYDLAARLRAEGVFATVHNHLEWPFLAEQAVRNYQEGWDDPVIVIGHSLGTDAAASMAYRLAQAGVPVKLVVTLDPVASTIADGSRVRVIKLYIFNELGVAVARGQSVDDQLVNLELRNRAGVWRAGMGESSSTLDQLILGYVLDALAAGPAATAGVAAERQKNRYSVSPSLVESRGGFHRESPSPRISRRGHRRVATPVAGARFDQRQRSSAPDIHGRGKLPTAGEAEPRRRGLTAEEREALFRQFLEWRKNRSVNP